MLHPVIEQPKPQQPVEPVQQIIRAEPRPAQPEPIKNVEVKEPAPVPQEVAAAFERAAPASTSRTSAVAIPPAVEYRETHPTSPASLSAVEATSVNTVQPPSAVSAEPAAVSSAPPAHPPVQAAAAAPSARQASTADYGWLAESLGRRIAALTRYPDAARLNGWEGKVVLRAVIQADGQLTDVKVHKSSGYEALDRAALETIRLACPLPMTHQLGTSEVAVNVPIVYSLSN